MICNNDEAKFTIGTLDLPLQPLIDDMLSFLDKYLPLFPAALVNAKMDGENEVEKFLNQQLVDFFNGHSPDYNQYLAYRFIFRKDDESKDTQSKPDIGITIWNTKQSFSSATSFFQIECKRLPTPNISSGRSEKEYVKGVKINTGGIERFKNNKHGVGLTDAALIGFVQSENLTEWYNKINGWIQSEIDITNNEWTEKDHLISSYTKPDLHRYNSDCKRVAGGNIKLHHFLINVIEES